MPSSPPAITNAAVEAELRRILTSSHFRSAPSLSRLLEFLVLRRLDGRESELKEYVVGVQVFDRGVSFDPRVDSIVRVQGSKLRARLRDYYADAGNEDPISIDLPRGAYVPVWQVRITGAKQTGQSSSLTSKGSYIALGVGCCVFLSAMLIFWISRSRAEAVTPVAGPLRQLSFEAGLATDPAFSPDGKLLAYASDRSAGNLDIWIKILAGGPDRQLTSGGSDESEPSFAPSGQFLAFRSEKDGGGIYTVPLAGGEPRLIAPAGRRPRFSPDGKWPAYWVGNVSEGHLFGAHSSHIYVMACTGGPSRQLHENFLAARDPTWSKDGSSILFVGLPDTQENSLDWYVSDLAGRTATATGALTRFRDSGIEQPRAKPIAPGVWLNTGVLTSARLGDSTNLWWVPLSKESPWRAGTPVRLTSGAGTEVQPALDGGGSPGQIRVAFASWRENQDLWSTQLPQRGMGLASQAVRLTDNGATDLAGEISPDGGKFAFLSNRTGDFEMWIRTLPAGTESQFRANPPVKSRFRFNPDGSQIAYTNRDMNWPIFVIPAAGGDGRKVCDTCGFNWDWSHDQRYIVYAEGNPGPTRFRLFDRENSGRTDVLYHPEYNLYLPRLSPDGNRIGFLARTGYDRTRIYLARFRPGNPPPEREWIPISSSETWDDKVTWSPDSNEIYFTSDRDGFRCIWGRRLDPQSKQPREPARPLVHSHRARLSIGNVSIDYLGLSLREKTLIFGQSERTGSIWLTSIKTDTR